jgi:hypothetical protein
MEAARLHAWVAHLSKHALSTTRRRGSFLKGQSTLEPGRSHDSLRTMTDHYRLVHGKNARSTSSFEIFPAFHQMRSSLIPHVLISEHSHDRDVTNCTVSPTNHPRRYQRWTETAQSPSRRSPALRPLQRATLLLPTRTGSMHISTHNWPSSMPTLQTRKICCG